MLTPFGKMTRKIRIDCDDNLSDFSKYLGVSKAYVSAVEHGKRNVPSDWVKKISERYNLSEEYSGELKKFSRNLDLIARNLFSQMSYEQKEKILEVMKKIKT